MDEVAVVVVDILGSIRYWSRGAEKVFGHPEEKAVGQSLDLIVPEEFRKSHWRGFRAAMASGLSNIEGQQSEFPVASRDGRIVNTPGKLTLLRGLDGNAVGAMVIFGLVVQAFWANRSHHLFRAITGKTPRFAMKNRVSPVELA